jgi:O-antigen/teichoic acid export membrane protein
MFGRRFLFFVAPAFLQAVVSVAVLPITTRILGPQDYGVFALVLAMTGLCATLSHLGVGFILAKQFLGAIEERQRVIMTTLVLLTTAVSLGLFAILWGAWSVLGPFWKNHDSVPSTGILLAGGEMIASAIWAVVATMCVQIGAARYYAGVTLSKIVISTAVLLFGLFGFHLGTIALFAGHLAGGLVNLIGALVLMRHYFVPMFDFVLAGQALRLGFSISSANVMENIERVYERTLLSSSAGMTVLGLYSHAQQYENMTAAVVRPASQAGLPIVLSEARAEKPQFRRTTRVWRAVYLMITVGALVFAFVGEDVIDLITNDKFGKAAPIAALLIAVNLVRFACRPHLGLLMAAGRGQVVALSTAAGALLAMGCLAFLVPVFGIWGAVAASYVHYFTFQIIVVTVVSRQHIVFPVMNGWEVLGVSVVVTAVLAMQMYHFPLDVRGWLAVAAVVVLVVCGRDIISDIQLQLRQSLRPTS